MPAIRARGMIITADPEFNPEWTSAPEVATQNGLIAIIEPPPIPEQEAELKLPAVVRIVRSADYDGNTGLSVANAPMEIGNKINGTAPFNKAVLFPVALRRDLASTLAQIGPLTDDYKYFAVCSDCVEIKPPEPPKPPPACIDAEVEIETTGIDFLGPAGLQAILWVNGKEICWLLDVCHLFDGFDCAVEVRSEKCGDGRLDWRDKFVKYYPKDGDTSISYTVGLENKGSLGRERECCKLQIADGLLL
jgi:hypothetical protein